MLFRQLFERDSSTYTYLLAGRAGGEALLIDPVKQDVPKYVQLIDELGLRLVYAIDTHVHADHVTGIGALRRETSCATIMGEQSCAACVTRKVSDGEMIRIDGLELGAIHTPGHTDDSFSFVMRDRVFTGDTLLIRGTGRTDFQNGDARAQYHSIFEKLLVLPEETLVYPAHDYRGFTVSTIGEERAHNPRLNVRSADEYAALMDGLRLPSPRLMDVAVPANLACGAA
jgi:glyoxylase-like metal-dependent hydrolase (beta-lactamase superfamily II)